MTWDEYKSWVTDNFVKPEVSRFWRGQRDSTWSLRTSFHRSNQIVGMNLYDYRQKVLSDVEYYYHIHFGEVLDLYDKPSGLGPHMDSRRMIDLTAFLGQLQHFGFPTPMLDWTMSPYIAAYFAFREIDRNQPQNPYARVFAFDVPSWTLDVYTQSGSHLAWDMWNTPQGANPFIVQLKPVPKHNARIAAQQGRFTITNIDDMLSLIHAEEQARGKTYIEHVDIDSYQKKYAMADLEMMGVTEMNLFPDFEGLCRAIRDLRFL